VKRTQDSSMYPAKVTELTYILSCSCHQELKRDLIPGQPKHNKRARDDFHMFFNEHQRNKGHKVDFTKKGMVAL